MSTLFAIVELGMLLVGAAVLGGLAYGSARGAAS